MRRSVLGIAIVVSLACFVLAITAGQRVAHAQSGETEAAQSQPENADQAFQELFAMSMKDGKGLVFHVGGQSIPGVVTRVIGDDAVEVRNREYGRIVLRLERVDAVAAN